MRFLFAALFGTAPAAAPAPAPAAAAPRRSKSPGARPAVSRETRARLKADFKQVAETLKDTTENVDWEVRAKALATLPALVASAHRAHVLDELLPILARPLATQLGDLRSKVVGAGCACVVAMATSSGDAAELPPATLAPLLPLVLPQLFKNLYVSVKAISACSDKALLTLMATVAPGAANAADVVVAHARDSHHQTRRGAVECIVALLSDANAGSVAREHLLHHREAAGALRGAVKAAVADADKDVRGASVRLYWTLHRLQPDECAKLLNAMESQAQKMIKRAKPKA